MINLTSAISEAEVELTAKDFTATLSNEALLYTLDLGNELRITYAYKAKCRRGQIYEYLDVHMYYIFRHPLAV